jgi:pyridoxine kinase
MLKLFYDKLYKEKTMNSIKRVAAINDLSGFCRCSLTVAMPVFSSLGLWCCPLPTAILSNHTGYDKFFFDDYTDKMNPYWKKWEENGIEFDAIYTGFLGSEKQIDIVMEFIKKFKNENNVVVIDPVMGDDGVLYSTYTKDMQVEMKKIIKYADVITPNVTECSFLSDTDYTGEDISVDTAREMCKKIKGVKNIVVTGIRNDDKIINYIYDTKTGNEDVVSRKSNDVYYAGTGDVFSSVLCGYLVKGEKLKRAVEKSALFVEKAVNLSVELGIDHKEGLAIEKCLKDLTGETL